MALIVWCGLGLTGWWAMLRGTPGGLGGRVFPADWRAGDAVFAGLLGLYFLLSILTGGGEPEAVTQDTVQGGIALYLVMLGLLLAFLTGRGLPPVRVFGLAPPQPLRVLAAGAVCFAATYPVAAVLEQLATYLGHPVSDSDGMVQYLGGPLGPMDKASAVALAVIAAPLTEEFVFRG
ncbi:MAG: hypothetical protein PHC88_16220, partial [Terrimicrobiaceae bacterium]|nr:hypothetical protein [Terrimicrobiaceae bacterium]